MKKLVLIVPALAALTLSACGGSSSDSGSTGTQTSAAAAAPAGQPGAFMMSDEVRSCLEKQGVQLPAMPQGNGTPPAGGAFGAQLPEDQRQKLQDAMKECGVQVPYNMGQGGTARPDTNSAAYRASVRAYTECVRQNGFDLPDPDFSGDGPIFDPDVVDQSNKAFQEASAKCQDKLLPPTATTPTTTTTTSTT